MTTEFLSYITENALILIPVIYILGMIIKHTEKFPDKYVPIALLPVGILLAMAMMGVTVDGFVQGVLITGAAVFGNQLVKQLSKIEE